MIRRTDEAENARSQASPPRVRLRRLLAASGIVVVLILGLRAAPLRNGSGAEVESLIGATAGEVPPGAGARPVEVAEEGVGYRVVRHAAGATRVPAEPKRICALACADELLSIGLMPVAHSIQDGNFPDYLAETLADVPWIPSAYGSAMPNMEAVADVEPDLIICRTPSRQTYEQLSKIAPVVVLLDHLENYRQRVLDVGAIVGRRCDAERRVAWYDAKVAATQRLIRERLGERTMAFLRVRPKLYRLHGADNHVGPVLYRDLEVRPPRVVAEKLWESTMSPEGLLDLDADYLIVAADSTTGSARTLADLLGHPAWTRIPAVQAGHVHTISKYRHWADAGILGRGQCIDDVLRAVAPERLDEINVEAECELQGDRA